MLLSTFFQPSNSDNSDNNVFPGLQQYQAGALNSHGKGHSQGKNQEDPVWLEPGVFRLKVIHFTTAIKDP